MDGPRLLRFLYLEDNTADVALVRHVLEREGFDVDLEHVDTREAFLKGLEDGPDVILADHALPRFNSTRALALVQEQGFDLPFIIVSGVITDEAAVAAIKQGAFDFVLKDRLARLGPSVRKALREQKLRQENEQAEEDLKKEQERLALALEAAGMGTWEWDVQSGQMLWTEETKNVFSPSGQEFEGTLQAFLELVHPEDRRHVQERIDEAFGQGSYHAEFRIVRADRRVRWVEARGRAYRDEQGMPLRMAGTVADVTERKRTAEALREAEAKYRGLVEQSLVGVCIIQDGNFAYVNPTLAEIFGYSTEELLHSFSAANLAVDEDRALVAENIRRRIVGDVDEMRYTFRGQHKAGRLLHVEVHGRRVDYRGRPAVMGTLLDITDQKRYEQQLIEARQQAEEMNRLKSAFLSNMSHEIRTPLTGIIGFAEILADEVTGEPRELADLICGSGTRLMETLNSVLDLAQLESGTQKLQPTLLNLNRVVCDVAAMFELQAQERGLTLRLDLPSEPVSATLDRSAFDRILSNLLSNAIKFTHEGSVVVAVEVDGEHVEIQVQDTGIGIDEAFVPHLFDEFKQESTGLDRDYEGSGLGLSITKRLVEFMDGTIDVESTKGEGSVFWVRFPRNVSGVASAASNEPTIATPSDVMPALLENGSLDRMSDETTSSERDRVLVVEDNAETQHLVERLLSDDYAVEMAATGEAALAQASEADYDLVLLDINLGSGMGGEEVLRELRKRPYYHTVPIIAVTAHALPDDRDSFLKAGFDGYLSKPFTRQDLMQTVRIGSRLGDETEDASDGEERALDALLAYSQQQGVIDNYEHIDDRIVLIRGIAYFRLKPVQAREMLENLLERAR